MKKETDGVTPQSIIKTVQRPRSTTNRVAVEGAASARSDAEVSELTEQLRVATERGDISTVQGALC